MNIDKWLLNRFYKLLKGGDAIECHRPLAKKSRRITQFTKKSCDGSCRSGFEVHNKAPLP